jgi:hypothetical protein
MRLISSCFGRFYFFVIKKGRYQADITEKESSDESHRIQ